MFLLAHGAGKTPAAQAAQFNPVPEGSGVQLAGVVFLPAAVPGVQIKVVIVQQGFQGAGQLLKAQGMKHGFAVGQHLAEFGFGMALGAQPAVQRRFGSAVLPLRPQGLQFCPDTAVLGSRAAFAVVARFGRCAAGIGSRAGTGRTHDTT